MVGGSQLPLTYFLQPAARRTVYGASQSQQKKRGQESATLPVAVDECGPKKRRGRKRAASRINNTTTLHARTKHRTLDVSLAEGAPSQSAASAQRASTGLPTPGPSATPRRALSPGSPVRQAETLSFRWPTRLGKSSRSPSLDSLSRLTTPARRQPDECYGLRGTSPQSSSFVPRESRDTEDVFRTDDAHRVHSGASHVAAPNANELRPLTLPPARDTSRKQPMVDSLRDVDMPKRSPNTIVPSSQSQYIYFSPRRRSRSPTPFVPSSQSPYLHFSPRQPIISKSLCDDTPAEEFIESSQSQAETEMCRIWTAENAQDAGRAHCISESSPQASARTSYPPRTVSTLRPARRGANPSPTIRGSSPTVRFTQKCDPSPDILCALMRSSPVRIPTTQTSDVIGDDEVEAEGWSTLPPELRSFMEMFEKDDEPAEVPCGIRTALDSGSSRVVPKDHLLQEKLPQVAYASAYVSGSETEPDSDGDPPGPAISSVPGVDSLHHHDDTPVSAQRPLDISGLPESALFRRKLEAASRALVAESVLYQSDAEKADGDYGHYASAGAAPSVPPSEGSSTFGSEDALDNFSPQTLPEAVRAFAEMFEKD